MLTIFSFILKVDSLHTANGAILPDFNFAATGDWGCNLNTEKTVRSILAKDPELVLALGDFSYKNTANCWLQIVDPIDEKMKIVIGNHEIEEGPALLAQYTNHFNLTKQYYSFNYHNVHFLVMSDYIRNETGSEQYNFVNDDLKNAAADPNIDWIIVNHHIERYASTTDYDIPEASEWNGIYHPLFEKYNIDLILQGHQHNYQRTYPIKYNNDRPDYPMITDKNISSYNDPEGQIFITVGTGGKSLQNLHGNKAPYLVTTQDQEFGFLNLDIINDHNDNNDTTSLVGIFYGNDATGIKDKFNITKSIKT